MKVSDVVTELEMELEESQNQRDSRIEHLWKKLDLEQKGKLDWKGLQKGLRKIDHPLKNADDMLKTIIKTVDTDGDGKVSYEEFRVFVEATERQLYLLFKSIDCDNNGRLDKNELQLAFKRAGLAVPMRRLNTFFEDIDMNNDGYISFDEWRDFLLFMPSDEAKTTLHAVFTFYSDIVTLTSEGDSVVSDETLEGLGTTNSSLIQALFGSLLYLAIPPDQKARASVPQSPTTPPSSSQSTLQLEEGAQPLAAGTSSAQAVDNASDPEMDVLETRQYPGNAKTAALDASPSKPIPPTARNSRIDIGLSQKEIGEKSLLIKYLPDPGYFVAGAVAGGISRTATAPLDRLKVYLLVNTNSGTNVAIDAARKGRPVVAMKNAGRPLFTAALDLYKSGGLRGFFAGNGLNVIKIMPETAIRFGAYEAAKKTLARLEGHGDTQHINPISKFVAGGVAGMTAQFCVYPLDTLKFRLQSEYVHGGPRGNKLLKQVLVHMWADGGTRAVYRGVTMGLIGMFPYSAIDMGTFEFLKTSYIQYKAKSLGIHEEDAKPSTFATGIMGASSGAFGATVVYPLNVLRTRLQTQGTKMHPARYTGIWDVANKTIRNEGVRGLYKGLMPNLLKVAPALSITWMVYENAKRIMDLN